MDDKDKKQPSVTATCDLFILTNPPTPGHAIETANDVDHPNYFYIERQNEA